MKKKEKTEKVYCKGCKWVKKTPWIFRCFEIATPEEYNWTCSNPKKRVMGADAYSTVSYKLLLMFANGHNDCKYWESK